METKLTNAASKMAPLALIVSILSACGGTSGLNNEDETTTELALGILSDGTLQENIISLSLDQLSAGGQTTVSVNIIDTAENSLYTESTEVTFSSNCVELGLATMTTPVTTATGLAQTTYTADGCLGTDLIKATLDSGEEASGTVSVESAELGSLTFVSVEPAIIAPLNISNTTLPTSAEVTFKLVDKTNLPLSDETVIFNVSSTVGDVELLTDSAKTDAEGLVTAVVLAGSQRDNITISASAESDATVSTQSQNIVVLTSAPTQNSLSLAAETYNPPCMIVQGENVPITVRVSDYYNTPAADGLQAEFYTRYGQIDGVCTISDGSCSVNWTTQDPRPDNGIVAIMATLKGEETTLAESNGNSLFDHDNGEQWTPLGEAFLDENGNGSYDQGEYYKDSDQNQAYTTQVSDKFRGTRCTEAAIDAGHCSELADIFENIYIACSNNLNYTGITVEGGAIDGDTIRMAGGSRETLTLTLSDPKGLAPIAGTSVAIEVNNNDDHTIEVTPNSFEVGNRQIFPPQFAVIVTLSGEGEVGAAGTMTIRATNIDGSETRPIIYDIFKE